VGRRKKIKNLNSNAHLFSKADFFIMPESSRVIEQDEVIKISGEHGRKFRFKHHVTRTDTGIEWIECIQLEKSISAGWRFFRPNRIKPLPKSRRPRKNKAA
jgi:hypothetical protein